MAADPALMARPDRLMSHVATTTGVQISGTNNLAKQVFSKISEQAMDRVRQRQAQAASGHTNGHTGSSSSSSSSSAGGDGDGGKWGIKGDASAVAGAPGCGGDGGRGWSSGQSGSDAGHRVGARGGAGGAGGTGGTGGGGGPDDSVLPSIAAIGLGPHKLRGLGSEMRLVHCRFRDESGRLMA